MSQELTFSVPTLFGVEGLTAFCCAPPASRHSLRIFSFGSAGRNR